MAERTIRFSNGDIYEGQTDAQGLPHGKGHMDYKLNGYYGEYDGFWEHGKRCGKGHYYKFSKGGGARHSYEYKGEWLDDKEHGKGKATESDQKGAHLSSVTEEYTGEFREGKRHGHGVIVRDNFDGAFSNGKDRFEGDFEDGSAVGHGVWEYANGDRFEGSFQPYFMKHGHSVYTFKDGTSYEADWKEGNIVPESIVPDPSIKTPILIIREHHSGFDYNNTGLFLLIAREGVMFYSEGTTLSRDYSFYMKESGIMIMAVTGDSVTFEVSSQFTADNKSFEYTIHRGEKQKFEDIREGTATIYDEDYDYTIKDSLEIFCR